MILNEHFSETTISIAFIRGSLSKVHKELKDEVFDSLNKEWKEIRYTLTKSNQLTDLFSISDDKMIRCLLWQPLSLKSDITVFFTNVSDGWQTLLNAYHNKFHRDIFRVKLSGKDLNTSPMCRFEHITSSNHRIVQVMYDYDKWVFSQKGKMLPYENIHFYQKRRILNRLNNEIIIQYLKANYIDIENDNFWQSNGKAIEYFTNLKN